MNEGKVYIAGAGPGDIGLITLKTFEKLQIADVILYDNLANKDLLDFCKNDAEKIFVGKEAGKHHVSQTQTIEILKTKAKEGKTVLRLKGGDPLIFGRGSEEASALRKENINFEIIPGISAASGASAYSGIPLTHRNLVTQCIFITAHESPNKKESQIEWEKLANLKNTTIAIYMGAAMLPKITKKFIDLGRNPNEKIAIVQNATLPSQKTFVTTLSDVEKEIINENIQPPIITFITPTIDLIDELKWYERKSLFGKRIVLTRALNQSRSLKEMLREEGATVIQLSTIKIIQSIPNVNLNDIISKPYDWVIFTSENGVKFFFELLFSNGLDSRIFYNKRIATIGSETAKSLYNFGIKADFIPTNYTSIALINEFQKNNWIEGQRFLRIKGDFHFDYVAEKLMEYGGIVQNLEVYKTLQEEVRKEAIDELRNKSADAFIFTSSSTVMNFFSMQGETNAANFLSKSLALAIGPVTASKLKEKGVKNIAIADNHTANGIVKKLKEIFTK
jgi:uroporphyrinogen III methyltransferase/synthase